MSRRHCVEETGITGVQRAQEWQLPSWLFSEPSVRDTNGHCVRASHCMFLFPTGELHSGVSPVTVALMPIAR